VTDVRNDATLAWARPEVVVRAMFFEVDTFSEHFMEHIERRKREWRFQD